MPREYLGRRSRITRADFSYSFCGTPVLFRAEAWPNLLCHHDLSRTIGIIAVLTSPVDFDAQDRKPVDIVCLVIGPQGADSDHLKCVSSVARSLREAAICDQLRAAATAEELLACLGNASDVAA